MTRAALISSVAARSGFPAEQVAALADSLWQPDGERGCFTAQHVAALLAQMARWSKPYHEGDEGQGLDCGVDNHAPLDARLTAGE